MKKTTTSKRLRRSATAYTRLGWKASKAGQHREATIYFDRADKLRRQAQREEQRG